MKLSLIVHVNKDRGDRAQCLLTRLTLNKKLHSEVDFEVVVFDGGSSDNTKDICNFMSKILDLKYVYVPLSGPTEEAYALSLASKFCTGDVVGFVSADHWISENLVKALSSYETLPGCKPTQWITGLVLRSEDSKVFENPEKMVDQLLDDRCAGKEINSIIEIADIEKPTIITPDVWSVRKEKAPNFNTVKWFENLIDTEGGIQESPKSPLAIDMWSPPQKFVETPPLGEFAEYSYVVIDGNTLEVEEAEEWYEQRS